MIHSEIMKALCALLVLSQKTGKHFRENFKQDSEISGKEISLTSGRETALLSLIQNVFLLYVCTFIIPKDNA